MRHGDGMVGEGGRVFMGEVQTLLLPWGLTLPG